MPAALLPLHRQPLGRSLAGVAGAAALVAAFAVGGAGCWQLWTLLVAPDLALLAGIGSGLEPGQLHPRAVPLYNAVHRPAGPALLAALALLWLGPAWLAGALAWAAHVAIDRAAGYGLRAPDGRRR